MQLLAQKLFKVLWNNLIKVKAMQMAKLSTTDIDDKFVISLDKFINSDL